MIFGEKSIRVISRISILIAVVILVFFYYHIYANSTNDIDRNHYRCQKSFIIYSGRQYKGVITGKFIDTHNHGNKTLVFLMRDRSKYCFVQSSGGVSSLYHMAQIGDSVYSDVDRKHLVLKKDTQKYVYAVYQTEGYNFFSEHK